MKCNGQCILMQKLKKVQEPISAPSLPKISFEDYPIGFVNAISYECSFCLLRTISFAPVAVHLVAPSADSLFHPPNLA